MPSPRSRLIAALTVAGVLLVGALLYLGVPGPTGGEEDPRLAEESPADGPPRLSITDSLVAARCGGCHSARSGFVSPRDHFLNERIGLAPRTWADSARVEMRCTGCHALPSPGDAPRERWREIVDQMNDLIAYLPPERTGSNLSRTRLSERAVLDLAHYFAVFGRPRSETRLPPDPKISQNRFEKRAIGFEVDADRPPRIGHVQIVDLDRDGRNDVLVSDFDRHGVTWIRRDAEGDWREEELVDVPYPGRVSVADLDADGDPDLLIPDLGDPKPTDDRVGAVYVAWNRGGLEFERETVLVGVGRTADARAGDFDGDGDLDAVVAVFGAFRAGRILWLEQRTDGTFERHEIARRAGAIHVPVADLNGDGRPDVVALLAQQHEEVTAYVNQGDGRFEPSVFYRAPSPTFGSSGIRLIDLDRDGDRDVLFTNGDAYDVSPPMLLASHGVQWLENRGDLRFEYHRLLDLYGAYSAVAADFDGDGDRDVAAVSLINEWTDPDRRSVVWLENDGSEAFTAHGVASSPNYVISADAGDLTGDGRADLVTGDMHAPPQASGGADRTQRLGRVTLWENAGP